MTQRMTRKWAREIVASALDQWGHYYPQHKCPTTGCDGHVRVGGPTCRHCKRPITDHDPECRINQAREMLGLK